MGPEGQEYVPPEVLKKRSIKIGGKEIDATDWGKKQKDKKPEPEPKLEVGEEHSEPSETVIIPEPCWENYGKKEEDKG